MRKWWVVVLSLMWLMSASVAGAKTVSLTDMAGRNVSVPQDPERIICLGPGALRLIVYLTAHDKVVGIEEVEKRFPGGRPYKFANPSLVNLPSIGPGGPGSINKKPDMEAVLRARPQTIFVTYMTKAVADEVQRILGIPIVVLSYGDITMNEETVLESLRVAGKALNRESRARAVVDYMAAIKRDLRQRTQDISRADQRRVYVGGIGYRGPHGIESTEQPYIPLRWLSSHYLGGTIENRNRIGEHVFMDKEALLRMDPDVIFIDGTGWLLVEADYRKKPAYYRTLKAFKSKEIYILLPFNYYATNISTAMADAYAMGKILYPDRFTDIDLEKKADEIYTFMVGGGVYRDLTAEYGDLGRVAPFWK